MTVGASEATGEPVGASEATGQSVVIEVGPATVRGPGDVDDESVAVALECFDDELAIVGDRPVAVARLWREVLAAAAGEGGGPLVLVCPSWWPPAHIDIVCGAARSVAAEVDTLSRAEVLAAGVSHRSWAVVEIAADVVVVTRKDAAPVAIPRTMWHPDTAGAVAARLEPGSCVVVDVAAGADDAVRLGEAIAGLLRGGGSVVTLADSAGVRRAVHKLRSGCRRQPAVVEAVAPRTGHRARTLLAGSLAAVAAVCTGLAVGQHREVRQAPAVPMTLLVEGRVGVTVPAQWRVERVTAGPGSARVQLISPSHTDVALHITQSPLPGEQTLPAVADALREAFDEQPPEVFVDFNADDRMAGKSVISYREVRADHHIRWAVLIDGMVRIGLGCQSAPAHDELMRYACEEAIRSAHAVF